MENVIFQASLALLSAALAGWFAIHTYFRQREHELILTRYLEGGIDLLAAELQRVVTIFNHNWARCLALLSSFRDLEADFDIGELQRGFLDLESSNPHVVAHHRLFTLVGTHEFWLAYQSATAFFSAANTVLVKQIPDVLRMKLMTERVEACYADVAEEGFEEARKQQDNSHKYVELLTELQNIAASLEAQRLAFKKLNQFKSGSAVQESIQRLNNKLGAEIGVNVAAAQQSLRGGSRKAARGASRGEKEVRQAMSKAISLLVSRDLGLAIFNTAVGAAIALGITHVYYVKAGQDLEKETARLRQIAKISSRAIQNLQNGNATFSFREDANGDLTILDVAIKLNGVAVSTAAATATVDVSK